MSSTTQNGNAPEVTYVVDPPADHGAFVVDTNAKPKTDVTVTNDASQHDQTRITDGQVTYDAHNTTDTNVHGSWPAEADEHVRALIQEAQDKRQAIEDVRANHRNHNRLYTLLFTLCAGALITFGLYHGWFGTWGPAVGPYSFVITVAGDTLLTAYALIKHY